MDPSLPPGEALKTTEAGVLSDIISAIDGSQPMRVSPGEVLGFGTPLATSAPSPRHDTKPLITSPLTRSPSRDDPPSLATKVAEVGSGGKPKAFLSMLAPHSQKKQLSSKRTSTPKTEKTSTPRTTPRVSQRAVKRPRPFDDEDSEPAKSASRKTTPKTRPQSKQSSKKSTQANKAAVSSRGQGKWRPTDDLMLISAVQQTNDLSAVYLGIKFSCRFTLREIEERWYALLYKQEVSQSAVEAMRGLHPGVVTMALNNALWSQEEEAVLAKIPSCDAGHLETFQCILRDHPGVFHACRTATSLHHHWVLMGHYSLLNDQQVQLIPPGENVTDFSDAEDRRLDTELARPRDVREEALEQELVASDRQCKREIMELEHDLPLWRTVLDTGSGPDFGAGELALFRGKLVEFRMTKKSVTFGRATTTCSVDFDLSLEGPGVYKISREQATVVYSEDKGFVLHNDGRRTMFVDGRSLLRGKSLKLEDSQTIEIANMSLLVILNTDLHQVT